MGRLIISAIGAVLWAVAITALWSGVANVIATRHDSALAQAVSNDEDAKARAAFKWKAALKWTLRWHEAWLASPAPLYGAVWKETPKQDCELLRDRKDAWRCDPFNWGHWDETWD